LLNFIVDSITIQLSATIKYLLKLYLVFFTFLLSCGAYSRSEFSFCPAGGPPGWMNYFDYKRDQNRWRRYQNYQHLNYYPYYYRPV